MSRARCVPLLSQLKTAPGVKTRPSSATKEIPTSSSTNQDTVPPHLTQREACHGHKSATEFSTDPCAAMFPSNMDAERYQDLTGLSWFSNAAQPWAAAEPGNTDTTMHSHGNRPMAAYENYSYDYNAFGGNLYPMTRSDSQEEVKIATALTDILPMRHYEALHVQKFPVKVEQEELDIPVDQKMDFNFKVDPDFILDTPDLLNEIGDRDLIDFIVSDTCPQASPPRLLQTPPSTVPTNPYATPSPTASSPSISPPPKVKNTQMTETYLAIPRELTAGAGEDKKIPKMLILKTPQTSTINLQDIGMSIAERIKVSGKRPRTKRYSDVYEEEQDDDEEPEEKPAPSKRLRRTSTSSSVASSSFSDKYRELRDRNNEASRKSRQNRKEKEKDLMRMLRMTETENTRLRARSDELEQLVHSLRKILLQIVVSKGTVR